MCGYVRIPYNPCVDEEDEIIVVHSEDIVVHSENVVVHSENIDIDVGLKVYK